MAACGTDSVLYQQEIQAKSTSRCSRLIPLTRSHVSFVSTLKMQRLPLLPPTSLSEAKAIVTREQLKVSLMYCKNWKRKPDFKCIFAMIQPFWFGMLWLCLILWSYYMLIDLTFFFFLISLTESISILPVNYLNSFSSFNSET